PRRRLVRAPGEPGEPRDGLRPARHDPRHQQGARRRARRLQLVEGRYPPLQGDTGACRAPAGAASRTFAACFSGLIFTTFQTRPAFSIARIRRPPGSSASSHQRRPCEADVGKAWWLWCQDSPNESTDSHATLVDLSVVSKRRRPKKWQTELMLQVTWWSM